ncbi:NADH-quinone oxidoreductase subunit J [Vacuolonema iberomarrocanum]|uniref:NADH-quinone oxidoreductase subunit J n=1 Tax=Vacuolonema iberomarrocanum TaxID=3454632 RepID=UPI001A0DE1A5|nr:NADH-quinone oxidoreductase subunit J [filamentous cyanobacterium LEGE 07170]
MNLAEGVQIVSLGVLAFLMLATSLGVVLLDNIVYSAFLLGGVFISISGLYILLNAGFVAAAQILIYVGAVNVLILFGIMLVNKRQDFTPVRNAWLGKAATAIVCFGLFALLSTMVLATAWPISSGPIAGDAALVEIGKHFFSDYLLPFELASVLLLMALIGAIVLARREFLPEEMVDSTDEVLTLPERRRELTSTPRQ